MSVERSLIEETLEELEENLSTTITDLEEIRKHRDKYSSALNSALYRHHDRLSVQVEILKEILAEADRRKENND